MMGGFSLNIIKANGFSSSNSTFMLASFLSSEIFFCFNSNIESLSNSSPFDVSIFIMGYVMSTKVIKKEQKNKALQAIKLKLGF